MAVQFVGAASDNAESVALPTHQPGDLLFFTAYRHNSTALPTAPSGWNVFRSETSFSHATSFALAYATSTSMTSGTWTNATQVGVAVYRSSVANKFVFAGTWASSTATQPYVRYTSLSISLPYYDDVWLVTSTTTRTDDVGDTGRSGYSLRTSTVSTGELAIHDSNATLASNPAQEDVATTSVTYRTMSLLIYEIPFDFSLAMSVGGSGGVPLIGHGGLVY